MRFVYITSPRDYAKRPHSAAGNILEMIMAEGGAGQAAVCSAIGGHPTLPAALQRPISDIELMAAGFAAEIISYVHAACGDGDVNEKASASGDRDKTVAKDLDALEVRLARLLYLAGMRQSRLGAWYKTNCAT